MGGRREIDRSFAQESRATEENKDSLDKQLNRNSSFDTMMTKTF